MDREPNHRRTFLAVTGAAGATALLAACASAAASSQVPGQPPAEEEVSPIEDLMREHSLLGRVLLVYEEIVRRIEQKEPFPADALASSADLVRRFVEDYHEKLEEEFVFPRFEKANKLVDLVTVLRKQHQAGRRVTEVIQGLAKPGAADPSKLVAPIREFIRMYRPHSAREDTVLFPEFRGLLASEKEYDALGEMFEDKEHQLFGAKGFEGIVVQVGQIEQTLGIHDLAMFTPA